MNREGSQEDEEHQVEPQVEKEEHHHIPSPLEVQQAHHNRMQQEIRVFIMFKLPIKKKTPCYLLFYFIYSPPYTLSMWTIQSYSNYHTSKRLMNNND